jgi:hypothetical protein
LGEINEGDEADNGDDADAGWRLAAVDPEYRGSKTNKKPRAKTPTMAYFCLRGRFNDERTGIGSAMTTRSLLM